MDRGNKCSFHWDDNNRKPLFQSSEIRYCCIVWETHLSNFMVLMEDKINRLRIFQVHCKNLQCNHSWNNLALHEYTLCDSFLLSASLTFKGSALKGCKKGRTSMRFPSLYLNRNQQVYVERSVLDFFAHLLFPKIMSEIPLWGGSQITSQKFSPTPPPLSLCYNVSDVIILVDVRFFVDPPPQKMRRNLWDTTPFKISLLNLKNLRSTTKPTLNYESPS